MIELFFPFIFLALMWLLLVRPQQQRVRKQRDLVASLEVGDDVVTAGGMVGRIVALTEEEAVVEVASGVDVRFVRGAINARLGVDRPDPVPGEGSRPADEGTD